VSYTELTRETPKARSPHKCTWCGEQILSGERYVRISAIFDGEFQTSKFHDECNDACLEEARYEGGNFEFFPYDNERPSKHKEPQP
jgi:hypothetical protein